MKQNAKICAIDETECNEIEVLYILGRERIDRKRKGAEGVERGLRVGAERDTEKRDKR